MKKKKTFRFLATLAVVIVLQTTNIFAASINYTETWDNNSLAEWTANTTASTVDVENSGGNPNGYLYSWGTLQPDTFDIGALTQCPVFTGDFSAAGVTGMSVDIRFISGTFDFDWAWLRLRYKDASHNGWMYSLTDTFGNTWQTYSVNFSPDWNEVEAEAAGWHPDNYWLSGAGDSNSWQETLSDVYTTEVRISGVNDVNAGIDNFSIILAEDICGGPDEIDLCAGQDDPVGTVIVKNDGNNLTVTYDTNDGWYLVETHLAVAESLGGIPQTNQKGKGKSKGGPIPGQFPYGDYFNPADMNTTASYVIDMNSASFEPDDLLYIAAHAVVQKIEVLTPAPYGASSIIDANQGSVNPPGFHPGSSDPNAVLADDATFFSLGFGGELILMFDCPIQNHDGNDLVISEVTGGNRLTYPLETVDVFASQNLSGPWTFLGTASSLSEDNHLDLNGLDEATYIAIVDTTDPNNFMPEGSWPNADGFDLQYVGSLQDCIRIDEETAWGDGCEGISFPGNNWATYFTFIVGACEDCSQEP